MKTYEFTVILSEADIERADQRVARVEIGGEEIAAM